MQRALLSLAVIGLSSGCMIQRDYAPGPVAQTFTPGGATITTPNGDIAPLDNIHVTRGHVGGDIGAVRQFDADTDQVDAWYDDAWKSTSITLTANDAAGRMGMVILDVEGVDLRTVPSGAFPFSAQSVDPTLSGGGFVNVTGCSSDPNSYYDEPALDGTITIQDAPDGSRDIEISTNLPDVDADGSYTSTSSHALGTFSLR